LKSAVSSNISFVIAIGVSSVATVLFLPIFHLLFSLEHPQFEQCCIFEDTYFFKFFSKPSNSMANQNGSSITSWQKKIMNCRIMIP